MIDKCNKDHGGLSYGDPAAYLELRPSPEYQELEIEEAGNASQELVAATENLKVLIFPVAFDVIIQFLNSSRTVT